MTTVCLGCGLILPNQHLKVLSGYNSSGECYQKYSELSHYTLSKQDANFIHQHAIDTYSAQHAGAGMKNITVVFSLIGMYFALEHGFTGRQVQRAHMLLSGQKRDWPTMELPSKPYSVTVQEVLDAEPGKNRDEMLAVWMQDVWRCWVHQHDWIRKVSKELLS